MNKLFKWFRDFFSPGMNEDSKADSRVKRLRKQLRDTVKKTGEWQKKMKEVESKISSNLQDIRELKISLEQHRKLRKAFVPQREKWARERKDLEECIAKLEATLEFQRNIRDEEREKVVKVMDAACQKNYSRIKANLSNFDEQWKTSEKATEQKVEAEKRLQKTAQQMVDLSSAIQQEKLETEKARQESEDDNDMQVQIISEMEGRLDYRMQEKKTAEFLRDKAMRERNQLEKRVAQMEAVLAFQSIRILSKKFSKFPEFCAETKKERRKWRMKTRYKLKRTILLLASLTPVLERNESRDYVDFREALKYLSTNKLKASIKIFHCKEAGHWGVLYVKTVKVILALIEKEISKL